MSAPPHGLFGAINEAKAISEKLGVSIEKAFAIQRRVAANRCKEPDIVLFSEDPKLIVEKVAAQMGLSPDEAAQWLEDAERLQELK